MHDDTDWQLIARHLSGLASPEEQRVLERWLAADPARRELVARLRETWDRSADLPFSDSPINTRAAWDAVAGKLNTHADEPAEAPLRLVIPRRSRLAPLLRVAAIIALIAGSVVLWELIGWGPGANRPAPRSMQTVATAKGERADIRLGDGSRILVGVDTRVRYAQDFGRCPPKPAACVRDVFLEGEAYFDVIHDETRPFRVHTAHAVMEDIGTAFTVRAYTDEPQVEVAVEEGEVALQSRVAGERVLLTKGDLGRVSSAGRLRAERGVNLDRYLSWTTGRLTFDRTPLTEVLAQLGRWYDVRFEVGDSSLASRRFSATLRIESLPELLDAVALALDLRYERQGGVVVLLPHSRVKPEPGEQS